jgi:hypothetical protein
MREKDHLQDPGVDGRIILRDTVFWWGNISERDHLEDPSVDARIILRNTGFRWRNMRERDHFVRPRRKWEDNIKVTRVLVGKHEGKRPLGRPRRRWRDNIKMDFQKVGCECVNLIELAQDRDRLRAIVNAAMNLPVPLNAGNFSTSREPVNFSSRILFHGVSKQAWIRNI